MGKKLNLKNPQTFNEKLQWLKLYDRNPAYTQMVDKYEVKKYVANIIGEEYIIPTLGIWDSFDEIDFDALPDQFVLKCTHDSGGVVICQNKSDLDLKAARDKITNNLHTNYYLSGREWPYKDVKPRIIAEKYLNFSETECAEYKLFCFKGSVKCILVCKGEAHGREGENTRTNDFYDEKFNHLPLVILNPNSGEKQQKPKELQQLVSLAERLSSGFVHLRVDFYLTDGCIYFGELTFFHNSGFNKFEPEEWNKKFGEWIELPK